MGMWDFYHYLRNVPPLGWLLCYYHGDYPQSVVIQLCWLCRCLKFSLGYLIVHWYGVMLECNSVHIQCFGA